MFTFGFWGFAAWAVAFTVMQEIIQRRFRSQRARQAEAPGRLVLSTIFAVVLPFVAHSMRHQRPYAVQLTVGIILVVAGLALSTWSQVALGEYWVGGVGRHEKHKLITTGPYKFVRHPLYAGAILSALGFVLGSWNVWYALTMLLWIGGFLVRIIGEEHTLRYILPEQYPAYAARTGMLLPKLPRRK